MDQEFLTITEVAKRLKLHVKTVLIHVREGRLKATRVGKQYRVTPADLAAYAGGAPPLVEVSRKRRIEVSSIVEIDAIDGPAANRVTTHLLAALQGRPAAGARARLDTIYYEEIARLKLIILADIETTNALLNFIPVLIAN